MLDLAGALDSALQHVARLELDLEHEQKAHALRREKFRRVASELEMHQESEQRKAVADCVKGLGSNKKGVAHVLGALTIVEMKYPPQVVPLSRAASSCPSPRFDEAAASSPSSFSDGRSLAPHLEPGLSMVSEEPNESLAQLAVSQTEVEASEKDAA